MSLGLQGTLWPGHLQSLAKDRVKHGHMGKTTSPLSETKDKSEVLAVLISIGLWKWLPHHLWFWREICPFSRSTFGDKFDEFSFATLSSRNKCTALERNAEKSHAGHAFQKQVVDALVRYVSLSRYVALLEVAKGQNNRDELENKLSCRWTNQQNFRGKREGRWEDLEGRL